MPASKCSECKNEFAVSELVPIKGRYVCGGCKPIVLQKISEGVSDSKYEVATFGSRFGASFVDGIIQQVVSVVFIFAIDPGMGLIVTYLFPLIYAIFFVGAYGQTPGKMLFKIKIINMDGTKVSYLKAFARYLGYFVSTITLMIGYLMAIWDKEYGRALHDRMCSTRVIKLK